jgi:hypothetical protein
MTNVFALRVSRRMGGVKRLGTPSLEAIPINQTRKIDGFREELNPSYTLKMLQRRCATFIPYGSGNAFFAIGRSIAYGIVQLHMHCP